MQNCAPVNFMMQHKHTHAHSFIKLQSNRDTDNRDKETNKTTRRISHLLLLFLLFATYFMIAATATR